MQKRRTNPALTGPNDPQAWLRRAYGMIAAITVAVVLVDQLTKNWALNSLGNSRIVHVLGSLEFALVRNQGVAFGIGAGIAPILIAVAIIGFVLVLLGKQIVLSGPALVGAGLVLGGALGNVGDRLFRDHGGAVVDFINLQWWPVFNVADACIVVGAVMLVIWGSKTRA